jgi:membrane protein required for colicin V production
MIIDIVFFILIGLACYKGYTKGFILAIFSVLGFIVGLAAALKLSTTVAAKLSEHTDIGRWLPALSFLLVFMGTAFLVKMAGKLIQKTFETAMLGWANRIAGILLFALLYSIIYSIFLFYTVQLHFIKAETTSASAVYAFIQPLGPKVIEGFGVVIPWFKNMFLELEQFFGKYAETKTP